MKALILNSGLGTRMGEITKSAPKCMTEIDNGETILSRQLKLLLSLGIKDVVMTTGYCAEVLEEYCESLQLPMKYSFIHNPLYEATNYIYSIYCAKDELMDDDILLMHGDLVFDFLVLKDVLENKESCMVVSSTAPIPEKDFKAVIQSGKIVRVGVEFFRNVMAAQPLYRLNKEDWKIWLEQICRFCGENNTKCYAENALNEITDRCQIVPMDVYGKLCQEIDTWEDREQVVNKLREIANKKVYISFSTDILHSGHMALIKKSTMLGNVIVGVLTDEAVAGYKRFPLVPYEERKILFENIKGICQVVKQDSLSYKESILKYRPDYVVHGDDWKVNFQKAVRDEVVDTLATYGGQLVEFPYETDEKYSELDRRAKIELAMPDSRRGRLKKLIQLKGLITAIEAHSGITGLIVENTVVYQEGKATQFDAMWVSSLCDSPAKGKPAKKSNDFMIVAKTGS